MWLDYQTLLSSLTLKGLLLVQGGGGGAPSAEACSQESAEFDEPAKSCPFLLKGSHWRVKQQTERQCDCLLNEKITAPHLTENDPQHKDRVNKKLLLQMGHWQAGACTDTWTANVSPASSKCCSVMPLLVLGAKWWIVTFTATVFMSVSA